MSTLPNYLRKILHILIVHIAMIVTLATILMRSCIAMIVLLTERQAVYVRWLN